MSLWGEPVDISSKCPSPDFLTTPASVASSPTTNGTLPQPSSSTVARLDGLFNFQIVVFQVENTLFQVLKNGFMVPGTPFEAMFALPLPTEGVEEPLNEGDSLTNPIFLAGVGTDEFRAFLRILYPFIGPSTIASYEDWVGVLKLATMWEFTDLREKAISALSTLIKEKPVSERIMLGREYRVKDWLKEEYVSLAQKKILDLENLRDPSHFKLDWETIAKILSVRDQNFLNNLQNGMIRNGYASCGVCGVSFGYSYDIMDCRCRLPALVDQVFREEFQALATSISDLPSFPSLPIHPATPTQGGGKKKKQKK